MTVLLSPTPSFTVTVIVVDLEEMLESKGPYVLDVMVPYQEYVLPMIPGGMTVRDIIKA